jgi:hypothetical protein
MARAHISQLVKLAYEARDPAAALALLDRSIELGHRRIALIRYLQAQCVEAPLEARHHAYVRDVAARMSAETLGRVAAEARSRARHSAQSAQAARCDGGSVAAFSTDERPDLDDTRGQRRSG